MTAADEPVGLASALRDLIRGAVTEAVKNGPTNIAAAANLNNDSHTAVAYSDQNVTIIQHDGNTEIIHHDDPGHDQGGHGDKAGGS